MPSRLGSGPQRAGDLRAHPWFAGLDWEALARRELAPPWTPDLKSVTDCKCGLTLLLRFFFFFSLLLLLFFFFFYFFLSLRAALLSMPSRFVSVTLYITRASCEVHRPRSCIDVLPFTRYVPKRLQAADARDSEVEDGSGAAEVSAAAKWDFTFVQKSKLDGLS